MNDETDRSLIEAKAALRKVAQVKRARVRAATAGDGRRLLIGRASDIVEQCDLAEGAVVAGYYPINDEIDCLGLLLALRDLGRSIALPKMRGAGQGLDFYDWRASTKLEKGAFGIMEPALGPDCNSTSVLPDLVLLPLLAFDLEGGRLGYGGGYYDRTIAALRRQGGVMVVGVGYDEQQVDLVPRDGYDQLLDYIVTPSRFLTV